VFTRHARVLDVPHVQIACGLCRKRACLEMKQAASRSPIRQLPSSAYFVARPGASSTHSPSCAFVFGIDGHQHDVPVFLVPAINDLNPAFIARRARPLSGLRIDDDARPPYSNSCSSTADMARAVTLARPVPAADSQIDAGVRKAGRHRGGRPHVRIVALQIAIGLPSSSTISGSTANPSRYLADHRPFPSRIAHHSATCGSAPAHAAIIGRFLFHTGRNRKPPRLSRLERFHNKLLLVRRRDRGDLLDLRAISAHPCPVHQARAPAARA